MPTVARGERTAPLPPPSALRFDVSARPLDGPAVVPNSAWSMAAGPDGSIYVVDQTREEVRRWSPGEGFFDVAGDGHRGFSGDGGPATKASFDFSWASSVAVGRNGILYISDTGNGRIRAVGPDGIVQTVIGGGPDPLTGATARARAVALGNSPQWFGLATGPNDELYVGAGAGVYRLDRRELVRVVGLTRRPTNDPHRRTTTRSRSRSASTAPAGWPSTARGTSSSATTVLMTPTK